MCYTVYRKTKGVEFKMYVYIPSHYVKKNYAPSWTGNFYYPTMTIRGIFDSLEKATKSIENWKYKYDCKILERWIDIENINNVEKLTFDIQLIEDYLYINIASNDNGDYVINELVDEDYSVYYDKNNYLGVIDY